MNPQAVWLFKRLKRIKDQKPKNGLSLDVVEEFCKQLNKKRYASAMFAALFDISHTETPIGDLVRGIDSVAISATNTRSELKKYDKIMVDCLDSSCNNPLYDLCTRYKNAYQGRLPDLDKTDFNALIEKNKDSKKSQMFDPVNLF